MGNEYSHGAIFNILGCSRNDFAPQIGRQIPTVFCTAVGGVEVRKASKVLAKCQVGMLPFEAGQKQVLGS
jgi:hypothetical protein